MKSEKERSPVKRRISWLLMLPLLLACNLITESLENTPLPVDTPVLVSPSALPPEAVTTAATTVPDSPPPDLTPLPPTAEPGIEPAAPAVLPADLYYLNTSDQIMRLGADGLTLTEITNEPEPVIDFDVSPESGRLAYVSGNNLIETDLIGGGRIVKVSGQPLDPNSPDDFIIRRISNPRYAPDGSRITFGLNGINIIPSGAATDYQTILPSSPYPDLSNFEPDPDNPLRFFSSGEWSPDGSKLVVEYSFFPEGSGLAILNLNDGVLTDLVNPLSGMTCCQWAWTADSSAGYTASNLLAFGVPGLVRFDAATGEGTPILGGLAQDDGESGPDNPIRLFLSVFPNADGSLLSFVETADDYSELTGLPVYTMSHISPDGSSVTDLRDAGYPLWEVLWAGDGSGAIIVDSEFNPRFPPSGPMRWLPTDGGPVLDLPAQGRMPRWGSPAAAPAPGSGPTQTDFDNLKTQALADFGIELLEDGINDLHYSRFNLGDGRSLWYIHTVGFRDFNLQNHAVGLYAFENSGWQNLADFIIPGFNDTEGIPGPDYMNAGSVQQVFIEPSNGWLSVEGGIGAHGGTMHVLRFDGQSLTLEAENANGSPVAGQIEDINGDGRQEVLLDLTDYYIFSYAAGVRLINYEIRRWDGSDLVPVTLTRLENTDTATDLNNQALNLTEAELWKDARMVIDLAAETDPENETIGWNAAVINTIADARENANSSFPIMDFVFLGDYETVINILRNYSAADIFNRESPIIVGTSAEGSEELMAQHIQEFTTSALTLRPDLASAYFLRGWAAYLLNPDNPAALADVQRAAELAPDEELYAEALSFLQP